MAPRLYRAPKPSGIGAHKFLVTSHIVNKVNSKSETKICFKKFKKIVHKLIVKSVKTPLIRM
jgi:hypothetical protein